VPSTAVAKRLSSGSVSIVIFLPPNAFSEMLWLGMAGRSISIDGSPTNREAIVSCDTIWTKRRVGPMLGQGAFASATVTLSGIEMVHMMRKRQARYPCNPTPSLAMQFNILATSS